MAVAPEMEIWEEAWGAEDNGGVIIELDASLSVLWERSTNGLGLWEIAEHEAPSLLFAAERKFWRE